MSLEKDVQKILSEVTQKKTEYGNIDAKVTELLCAIRPNGFNPNEFDTFLLVSKLAEKLFRFSSENISKERKRDALVDLMGYALLGMHNNNQQTSEEEPDLPERQNPEIWKQFVSEVKGVVTKANEPYEVVGDAHRHLDMKLLEHITKYPGMSPRELESAAPGHLGYKQKPVRESLQRLLTLGKVRMNGSLKVEPSD